MIIKVPEGQNCFLVFSSRMKNVRLTGHKTFISVNFNKRSFMPMRHRRYGRLHQWPYLVTCPCTRALCHVTLQRPLTLRLGLIMWFAWAYTVRCKWQCGSSEFRPQEIIRVSVCSLVLCFTWWGHGWDTLMVPRGGWEMWGTQLSPHMRKPVKQPTNLA